MGIARTTSLSLLACAAAVLTGCSSGSGAAPRSTAAATTPAPIDRAHPWVVQRIHTGSQPCATLGAGGSVWVADIVDNTVTRLDPKSGRILRKFNTAAGPCGMAYGAGSIWVEDYTASSATRIDVATDRTTTIAVGPSPYDVTFAGGAAWVTNYGDATVTRIDAATNHTTTIKVGQSPVGIAPAAGAIWVADSGSGALSRIDEATLAVTTIPFGGQPYWTAYQADTVWIGDHAAGDIVRLDARTGRITNRVKVGGTPNDGDASAGSVWFPDKDGSLYRLSVATNAVTGPFATDAGNPFVISSYDGRLWIADYGGTNTIVVDPSKLPTR